MKDKIYHQPNLAKSWFLALLCFLALGMQSCRDGDTVISSEPEDTGSKAEKGDIIGLYWICRAITVKTSFTIATSIQSVILTRLRNWVM